MKIVKRYLDNVQYYPTAHKKTSIIWHHTAGMNAKGAIDWWNQTPEKVGTAYVIDRDGTVYECYDPKCWGYHLGIKGFSTPLEQHSIGIEIAAAGQLIKELDGHYFYPLFPSKVAGKKIIPTEVWEIPEGWRGYKAFHSYTDAQIDSLIELTSKLMADFDIKVQPNFEKFYEFNSEVFKKDLPGIWSHSTVRETGKTDIVPYPEFLEKIYRAFGKVPDSPKKEVYIAPPIDSTLEGNGMTTDKGKNYNKGKGNKKPY